MFDISFMELLVISIVALIVIGPERLPAVARTVGHLYGRCRNFVYAIRTDIHNEIRMEELKKMQSSMQETVQSIEDSVHEGVDRLKTTMTDAKPEDSPPSGSLPPQSGQEPQATISGNDETAQYGSGQERK
ncbi:Sec-independent protein translocase protein TatB [Nitrosomonas sp. Is24]|uniref:Sec-independent protein translocase protein TatB n=1 Tax=Nitrosomonas sp. Is24 TaxID=3080533 RepID=UPI00294B43A0|nr:Sec-independent protein translocase protein TatB [Nitrosomonas sp. Is24]MDV6341953.1 Sec-independent protein translocase protein TatB [Nitrosomonas sp. Is24]